MSKRLNALRILASKSRRLISFATGPAAKEMRRLFLEAMGIHVFFFKKNSNRCAKSCSAKNIGRDLVFGCQSVDSFSL